MRISFGAIAVQPQNKAQAQEMANIAYKTKETIDKRYGKDTTAIMQAQLTHDTVTFSSTPQSPANQSLIDGIMANYLRLANIPFKKI
jgi:hypothetical protein